MEHKNIEIVFLARGGQGAKTASLILANAYLKAGYFVQAFSEYGPERSGAPVKSYLRISENRIQLHSQIENPDYLIVLDDTLLEKGETIDYLNQKLKIIINTSKDFQELISKFLYLRKYSVFIFNANNLSKKILGKPYINFAMAGYISSFINLKTNEIIINARKEIQNHFPGELGIKNANVFEQSANKSQGFLKL